MNRPKPTFEDCWIKQPDGSEKYDAEASDRNMARLRDFIAGSVRDYAVHIEGPAKAAETIARLGL